MGNTEYQAGFRVSWVNMEIRPPGLGGDIAAGDDRR